MKSSSYIIRSAAFIAGLFIMSLGVVLSVKAYMGVSPISCIPYILSERYPLSLGQMTTIFNLFLILLQIVLLRRKYKPFQLIQLPVIVLFGFFIDLSVIILEPFQADFYHLRLLVCLLSCAVLALGVFIEVKAGITYLPGEGVALALTEVTGIDFGKAKILVDSSMVLSGVLLSFLLHRELLGVREGTILAALLVGIFVKFYFKLMKPAFPANA
ncbi:MAG: YitT family protein [Spirochaetales bacterium]|nr:YitT family protein [Spirochaetales bacterium]